MFKRAKLEDSTDDVITKMVDRTPPNIVVKVGENRFLIPVDMVKDFAIKSLPAAIVDERSEDAKKFGALRSALKAGIRPFLPDVLRKTWGRDVEVKPHLNILSWLPLYFIHFFIGTMARVEWRIDVKDCQGCGDHVFQVLRLAPNLTPEQPDGADRQSLPGRAEPVDVGKADSNLIGGSLGDSGNDGERKDDNGKGAIVSTEAGISSG
ncbi:MAG TPA: hypothetical protein VGN34_10320 [Ktedonobacteraceae bacterium]